MNLINNKLSLAPLNKINKLNQIIIILLFLFTIITISLLLFNSNIIGVNNTIFFNNINYNSILITISKICFWFSIGIKLYLKVSEGKLGLYLQNKINFINKLTFLQITL